MKTKTLPILVAIAACNYELPVGDDALIKIQVTPAGYFRAIDGRPEGISAWYIDAAVANRVIERFNQKKDNPVIDYDHQTLHKEKNGQEAPAAAWYKSLEWVEGKGLYATVELTQRAREKIADKEFKYFSPVFAYHGKTGEVQDVLMGAITNTPAVEGMDELSLIAAANFQLNPPEEEPVNKLLALIISALAMSKDTTEDQAVAALNTHFAKDPLAKLREQLGLPKDADENALIAACNSLKVTGAGNPDPSKYVPVGVVTDLQQQIAVLNQRFKESDEQGLEKTITEAIAAGKIIGKEMEDWARDLGKKDIAALNRFLGSAAPIAALSKSQTDGKSRTDEKTGLNEDELAICNRMGLDPEKYKTNKA